MFRQSTLPPPPPLPLLVTGAPGVPGYNALHYFQAKYPGQVYGLIHEASPHELGPNVLRCDAEDPGRLARLFAEYRFASVLDCSGNCALKACECDPRAAWRINVEGLEGLLTLTVPAGIRLVRLSVDLVYSGRLQGDYVEDDPPDPVTVYGKTMAGAEEILLERDPKACIVRISLPMGVSLSGHAGAIDWITSRFKKSRPATLFFDEIRTPTYTDCLNELYEVLLASDLSGIYHAGAPRPLSLYQIAQVINRAGGYNPDCLMGCLRHQAPPIPPRAGNVCMNSGKLRQALGYDALDPWPLDERFVPTHPDWHRERDGEPGSPELLHQVLCVNQRRRG